MSDSALNQRKYGTINLAAITEARRIADYERRRRDALRSLRSKRPNPHQALPEVKESLITQPNHRRFHLLHLSGKRFLHPVSIGLISGLLAAVYLTLVPLPAHFTPAEAATPSQTIHTTIASTEVAPATPKPAPVPTNRLIVPAIGVNAPIITVGLVGGTLGAPNTLWQVALYSGGSALGQIGTAIIDGHSGAPGQQGVFRDLSQLKVGDTITAQLINGHTYTYQVTSSQAYNLSQVSSQLLFAPSTTATLNLVSCTGTWQSQTQTFTERWIVTSQLVQQ